jgi:hypothetical protein
VAVRAPSFASAVDRWSAGLQAHAGADSDAPSGWRAPRYGSPDGAHRAPDLGDPGSLADTHQSLTPKSIAGTDRPTLADRLDLGRPAGPTPSASRHAVAPRTAHVHRAAPQAVGGSLPFLSLPGEQATPPSPGYDPPVADALTLIGVGPRPVHTRLGGVFYLLDLALYLGLYGDFTQPARPGIELDPWDFVTLLATELGAADDAPTDPVWSLLAALAGRDPRMPPGGDFRPSGDWRVPPEWLQALDADGLKDVWRWSSARGRLVVEHPAGFALLDVAVDGPMSGRRVARALRGYGRRGPLRRSALVTHVGRARPAQRWFARFAGYARARLANALGCAPDGVAGSLLRHEARIFVTGVSVDVELSIDDLPIAIRRAGLDRDPGWIPAARRTVAFHFR